MVESLELPRSRFAVQLERDLSFDPLFFRHAGRIERALRSFSPDVIHITGPSELGMAGAYFAWKLRIPLAASWHTNLHEYMAQRLHAKLSWLGRGARATEVLLQAATLRVVAKFYRLPRQLYAPTPQLCALLETRTGRPCRLMTRGLDLRLFTPERRTRAPEDRRLVLGYVGRLSTEKNVRLLPRVHAELTRRGLRPHWLIVGEGEEEAALRRGLGDAATFAGVLRGQPLAEAFANLDLFVFPSRTDTFGNAVLEALGSGVPAIVTPEGGPASIVADGVTGRIAPEDGFAQALAELMLDGALRMRMRRAARAHTERSPGRSWDDVFAGVYAGYASLRTVSGDSSLEEATVHGSANGSAHPQTPLRGRA